MVQAALEGQSQVTGNILSLQNGLSQIYSGHGELKTAFTDMQDQLIQLSDGLGEGAGGLAKIHDSLSEAQGYLVGMGVDSGEPIVIIPEETLGNQDFSDSTETYLSDDKKIAKWDVVTAVIFSTRKRFRIKFLQLDTDFLI